MLPSPNGAGASTAIAAAAALQPKPRRRTGNESDDLRHPLLGDEPTLQLLPPRDAVGARPPSAAQCLPPLIHASSLSSVKSPSAAGQAACDAAVQVLCSKET